MEVRGRPRKMRHTGGAVFRAGGIAVRRECNAKAREILAGSQKFLPGLEGTRRCNELRERINQVASPTISIYTVATSTW